ncbi:hypothetical protein AB0H36_10980 [Kribbella sp. NPDC050820]|uniref:hypothetical protein n=1 Tax=Kribbella sp. NPDC050820 TaxID=3155408 RepID=UPI003404D64C
MRVVRSVLGVLFALLGLIIGAAGAVAAFWLVGPDDTIYSGEQHLTSKGLAIASAPSLLDRHGPTLHVNARSTDGKPVFVGVARDFDAASYLKGRAHTELVQVEYPISLSTQDVKGAAGPLAAPDTLDWWVAKASGAGTQELTWPIADGPYSVVIMSADGKTAPDVQADLGIEIPDAFLTSLVVFAVGLVLLALGIFLILFRGRRTSTPNPVPAAQGGYGPPQHGPQSPGPWSSGAQYPGPQHPGPQHPGPQHPGPQYPGPQYPGPQYPGPQYPGPQPPPQQSPAGPLRRGVALTAVFALVSGCAAIPEPNTVRTLTRPAVTDETATAVIEHYNEVNNAASSKRDGKLIATVEGGNVLRQSQASFTISRALDKAGKELTTPYPYTEPVVGAPSFGSYPMRFVSSAEMSGTSEYRHLGVWERETAGSPWLLTFSAGPKKAVQLPDLAGVRPATKSDDAKLVAAPQAAAKALAEYLTAGAKSARAASFAPSTEITEYLANVARDKAEALDEPQYFRTATVTTTVSEPPTSFVTKSGTALVFVYLTRDYLATAQPNSWLRWVSGPVVAFSPSTVRHDNALTKKSLVDAALLIPPKGGGKIRLVSLESQLIDAGGY